MGWECAGRLASHEHADLLPGFNWNRHCPTVLAEVGARNFGLPTVLRFARFRVTGILVALIELMVSRETAQTAKGWPFFRASLTRSRSFTICAIQQSAYGSGTRQFKRNTAGARPWVKGKQGCAARSHTPRKDRRPIIPCHHTPSVCGRASMAFRLLRMIKVPCVFC